MLYVQYNKRFLQWINTVNFRIFHNIIKIKVSLIYIKTICYISPHGIPWCGFSYIFNTRSSVCYRVTHSSISSKIQPYFLPAMCALCAGSVHKPLEHDLYSLHLVNLIRLFYKLYQTIM